MVTLGDVVDTALQRANATNDTIKAYCITQIDLWLKEIVRSYLWDFMRTTNEESIVEDDRYVTLPTDYWKMASIVVKDADGNRSPVEIISRERFDGIVDLTDTGTPKFACILGTTLYFYYAANKAYTLEELYYKLHSDVSESSTFGTDILFPEKTIEQLTYNLAHEYDEDLAVNLVSDAKLDKMLKNLRNASSDEGRSGESIPLDPFTFGQRPLNFMD